MTQVAFTRYTDDYDVFGRRPAQRTRSRLPRGLATAGRPARAALPGHATLAHDATPSAPIDLCIRESRRPHDAVSRS